MRDILEDSALIYRQELESLFTLLVPGIILGPVLLIIAAHGLTAGLALVPVLLLLYLGTYAGCLTWAGYQLTNSPPPPGPMLLVLLVRAPETILSAAPVGLLLAAVSVLGLVTADQGFAYLSLLGAGAGFFATAHWLSRHTYELPLVVVYEASARQATEASARLDEEAKQWTLRLLMLIGSPVTLVGLLSVWLAWAIAPLVGAAVFLLALTLWMPFGSLCLVAAGARLLGEGESIRQRQLGSTN
jgi:hypothetical protein